jgi:hypothetical protein
MLLAGKADTERTDSAGRTPLWHAACAGQTATVSRLLAAGARPGSLFGTPPIPAHSRPPRADVLRSPIADIPGARKTKDSRPRRV